MRQTVKNRIKFINDHLDAGADVIFCSPQLVSEGINLDMIPSAIWYAPEYNVYVMPQANRRFLRLTQESDHVEIVYLGYSQFPEAKAFAYIAEKIAGQQALRGDIRAGLARILGHDTFVSRLQDATLDGNVKIEGDMFLDELLELPTETGEKEEPAAVVVGFSVEDLLKKHGLSREDAVAKRPRRRRTVPEAQLALF